MHALGRSREASNNKLMHSRATVIVRRVTQVALWAREAEISVDTVAFFKRVIRAWWADDRVVVVDWLRHWRWTHVHSRALNSRVGTRGRWMLFRLIRMKIILKFHRNSHLRPSYRHVVVDVVVGCWRTSRFLQEMLQVWHLWWRPLQDFLCFVLCL